MMMNRLMGSTIMATTLLATPAVQAGPINLTISDSLDGTVVNQTTPSGSDSFTGASRHFASISTTSTPSGGANLGTTTIDLTAALPGTHVLMTTA
jgi:hypothetical protein